MVNDTSAEDSRAAKLRNLNRRATASPPKDPRHNDEASSVTSQNTHPTRWQRVGSYGINLGSKAAAWGLAGLTAATIALNAVDSQANPKDSRIIDDKDKPVPQHTRTEIDAVDGYTPHRLFIPSSEQPIDFAEGKIVCYPKQAIAFLKHDDTLTADVVAEQLHMNAANVTDDTVLFELVTAEADRHTKKQAAKLEWADLAQHAMGGLANTRNASFVTSAALTPGKRVPITFGMRKPDGAPEEVRNALRACRMAIERGSKLDGSDWAFLAREAEPEVAIQMLLQPGSVELLPRYRDERAFNDQRQRQEAAETTHAERAR